jgi:LysM repeat protein
MTRDVKVGLLLGLAFIFMIAFVINGLPSFRGDGNELTKSLTEMPNRQPGIGAREREVIDWTASIEQQGFGARNPLTENPDIRFKTPIPQHSLVENSKTPEVLNQRNIVIPVAPKPVEERKPAIEPALPKVYVVTDGDNLALIAKKFYGEEEGNKRANIMKIFEANRNILKAADDIQVGQKLKIPPLSSADEGKRKGIFSSEIFKKVASIGRERLSSKKPAQAKAVKKYTVRDGDSLWRIAAEQLGDGSRFTEVAKLNDELLSDEDSLAVGMVLKLPAE